MDRNNIYNGQQAQQSQQQQQKPDAVIDNVLSRDQDNLKQFADIGNKSSVNGDEIGDVNMEAAISTEDVMRAGGFGAKDDIGSLLPAAVDSTDFEASLRDARDFEEEKEEPSYPGLGWSAKQTETENSPSDVQQQ